MKKLIAVSLLAATSAAPLATQASNLDGLYGGLHLGYTRDSTSLTYASGFNGPEFDLNGGMYGLQFGWNKSISSSMMFGIELDYSKTSVDGNAISGAWMYGGGMDSFASLRGRFGWQSSNLFLYGLAGLTYADVNVYTDNGTRFPDSATERGWILGAGAELSFSKLISARVELTKSRLHNKDMVVDFGGVVQMDMRPLMLNLGVNFHF